MLREQLDELSIFALRELARRTGVNSPTSKRKETLISEIIEISEGKKAPQLTKTKQGRPPKNYGYTFADVFMSDKAKQVPSFSFNQATPEFERNLNDGLISGYLDVSSNLSAFLWSKLENRNVCYYVPSSLVEQYNLKTGDFLSVNVLALDGQNVVKEILTIDNCPANKFITERKDYFEVEYVEPNKELKTDSLENGNLNIKLGECAFIYGNDNNQNTKTVVDVLAGCEGYKKIYLNVSLAEKNKHLLSGLKDAEMFTENIVAETMDVVRTVKLATERAKRLFENGEDVVLVVDDVQSVMGACEQDLSQVKQLVALTKNAEKGSITMFEVMPTNGIAMFEKLADKRFNVENSKLILM